MCRIEGHVPVVVEFADPEPIQVEVNLKSSLPPSSSHPRERRDSDTEVLPRARRPKRPRVWHIVAITVGLALVAALAYAISRIPHATPPVKPPVVNVLPAPPAPKPPTLPSCGTSIAKCVIQLGGMNATPQMWQACRDVHKPGFDCQFP